MAKIKRLIEYYSKEFHSSSSKIISALGAIE